METATVAKREAMKVAPTNGCRDVEIPITKLVQCGTGPSRGNPKTRNPESRIHKSKKTSSSNTQKLFSIAFACRK